MGRKKLRNRITSIIVHVENEVTEFKLNQNEDFEAPMNQINHTMSIINKRIAKILNNKKNNCNGSSCNCNPIHQEKSHKRVPNQYSIKNVKNVELYDMDTNTSLEPPINQNSSHKIFGTELTNFKVDGNPNINNSANYKSQVAEEVENNISNESEEDFDFAYTNNDQINNIQLINIDSQSIIIDDKYDLINDEETQNDFKMSELEDYVSALNNIFSIDRQLQ